jgi:hypothetical protein
MVRPKTDAAPDRGEASTPPAGPDEPEPRRPRRRGRVPDRDGRLVAVDDEAAASHWDARAWRGC